MKNKIIFLIGLIIAVLTFYLISYHKEYEKIVNNIRDIDEFSEIEKSFKKTPQIDDCIKLIDGYLHTHKDYNKAIKYGEKCIDIGANSTPAGRIVNFQLAVAYDKIGDNEKAKYYLNIALKLDEEGMLKKYGWIEKENLQHLITE